MGRSEGDHGKGNTVNCNTKEVIPPESFALAMRQHWQDTLANVSSLALEALWKTIAKAFNAAIVSTGPEWTVLQPPTGTGKTQGACLYSAMVAKENMTSPEKIGILIVTRLIGQAEEIAALINRLAGFSCAAARHSENKLSPEEVREADVLVVTHAAYTRALEGLCRDDDARWSDLVSWTHGHRRLTIVDEAIANVIEEYHVKAEDVRQVLAYITPEMEALYPLEVEAVRVTHDVLHRIGKLHREAELFGDDTTAFTESKVVWSPEKMKKHGVQPCVSLGNLRLALGGLRYDHIVLKKESNADRLRIAEQVDRTVRDIEAIQTKFAWCAKKGQDHTFNGSQLLIPDDLPAPVVLDATAKQNFLWTLLEDRAVIKPIPPNARSYRNVILHVARASGVGKTAMKEKGADRVPRLVQQLQQDLDPSRKVFVCLHKSIEHHALQYETGFAAWSVGHWGAVDGRNDWKDYDTAVIFGLPYRDTIWATNAFFATQGLRDNEWLRKPSWRGYGDVRAEMQHRQVCVSVVQAVNRIRCRKVTDREGNSGPADVFIVLPAGKAGDRMLEALIEEMPDIQVTDWTFSLDGEKATLKKGSSHEALLTMMKNAMVGDYSVTTLGKELGLTDKGVKKLRETLRDPDHPLTQALADVGVAVQFSGKGRAARTHLVKR